MTTNSFAALVPLAHRTDMERCRARLCKLMANIERKTGEVIILHAKLDECIGLTLGQQAWIAKTKKFISDLEFDITALSLRVTQEENEMSEHQYKLAKIQDAQTEDAANPVPVDNTDHKCVGVERTAKRKRSCRGKKLKGKPREPRRPRNVQAKPDKKAKGKNRGQNRQAA